MAKRHKYSIQTCHPNQFLDDKWGFVLGLDTHSMIQDTMQSPSFDAPRGTLVRVTNHRNGNTVFIGASDGYSFVDIGPESEIVKRHNNPGVSLLDLWKNSENPEWMLFQVEGSADKRQYVSFLFSLLDVFFHRTTDIDPSVYEAIKTWIHGGEIGIDIKALPPWMRTNAYTKNLYAAFQCLFCCIQRESYVVYGQTMIARCVDEISPYGHYDGEPFRRRENEKKAKQKIANIFRKSIPFSYVIEGVL